MPAPMRFALACREQEVAMAELAFAERRPAQFKGRWARNGASSRSAVT